VIEAQVHAQLRAYLRSKGLTAQPEDAWPHHLTLARLVARALRLGRSALIQVSTGGYSSRVDPDAYRLSYLMALFLWPGASLIVAEEKTLNQLLLHTIPALQQWLETHKPVCRVESWPSPQFQGVGLTTPDCWLADRLSGLDQVSRSFQASPNSQASPPSSAPFPQQIPTVIEAIDDVEDWLLDYQTLTIAPGDWINLKLRYPQQSAAIQGIQIFLTHCFFQHPPNPYDAYLLEAAERERLASLLQELDHQGWELHLPEPWNTFHRWASPPPEALPATPLWFTLDRALGTFTLYGTDLVTTPLLKQIWAQQPVVLLRETGDGKNRGEAPKTTDFSQRLGLESVTKVQFLAPRQGDPIPLYLPDRLPLPNTPDYQNAALRELRRLLIFRAPTPGLTVILIQDLLLKQQVGAILAAEFGSRVQVDRWSELPQGVVVASWDFWLANLHQSQPLSLLAITTLPFPSVEHPLVAARVAYHKHQQQDWFQSFLLPQAVRDLQRAIAPIRSPRRSPSGSHSGLLALLDTRLLHRSYGQQILNALSPITRLNYLDPLNT